VREHRLYQADWLMRFYGFERATRSSPRSGAACCALDVDPKLAWALAHPRAFPVDLNRAPRELLLRVPGLGVKAVDRCCCPARAAPARRRPAAPARAARKVLPFVLLADHRPVANVPDVRPPRRPCAETRCRPRCSDRMLVRLDAAARPGPAGFRQDSARRLLARRAAGAGVLVEAGACWPCTDDLFAATPAKRR
jgi:hypothetical protein